MSIHDVSFPVLLAIVILGLMVARALRPRF